MKLRNRKDVEIFREAIDGCRGDVWLRDGSSSYNLKSAMSCIVALGRVAAGDEGLELFADSKADECRLLKMFRMNPGMA